MNISFKVASLIISIILLIFTGCAEEIPAGLATTVRGSVIDSIKKSSLEGVKVAVLGCSYRIMYGPSCQVIDSVKTDSRGEFEISFVTDGTDDFYLASAQENENFIFASSDTVEAGTANAVALYARELNTLKIEVKIDTNSVGTIRLLTPGGNRAFINQSTRDTIIYGKVIPMQTNWFTFDVLDSTITEISRRRRSRDTLNVGLSDTTFYLKQIKDPKEWPTD